MPILSVHSQQNSSR